MLNVFLHNMYVLLIIADLPLGILFTFQFFSSSQTNIGPLKIKYKVVWLLQGYFLNAFKSETGLGSVNEFLVLKHSVIIKRPGQQLLPRGWHSGAGFYCTCNNVTDLDHLYNEMQAIPLFQPPQTENTHIPNHWRKWLVCGCWCYCSYYCYCCYLIAWLKLSQMCFLKTYHSICEKTQCARFSDAV